MALKTMNPTYGDVIKWEDDVTFSRENVTVKSGGVYKIGTVLGRQTIGGAVVVGAAALDAGAAGNGSVTLAGTPYTAAVKEGNYVLTATSATKFHVENPAGVDIGVATVGAAFSKEIAFTIVAGGNAFAAGDRFVIPVSVADGTRLVTQWDPAATDGTEKVYGVLGVDVDATSANVDAFAVVRQAIAAKERLIWKAGLTADQQADAIDALNALGVAVRATA